MRENHSDGEESQRCQIIFNFLDGLINNKCVWLLLCKNTVINSNLIHYN